MTTPRLALGNNLTVFAGAFVDGTAFAAMGIFHV